MNIFRILFELFVIYLLYKIVFNFIIPIYYTTKKVKKQFGEMQQKMQEQQRQQSHTNQDQQFNYTKSNTNTAKEKEDYIDYEEIKS